MHTSSEIISALEARYQQLLDWYSGQAEEVFSAELVPGKWSMGQHADHLIKSTAPLNKALRMPLLTLSTMFGKKNERPLRTYPEMVEKYQAKLAAGGVATARFEPPVIENHQKGALMEQLQKELEKLKSIIHKWDEKKMDVYLLPHPLLGKLTIREILFFTIYHTEHHYRALAENYTA